MRMLITSTVIAASLLLAGASAMAADANVHKPAATHVAQAHVAKTHLARAHTAVRTAAQRTPRYAAAPYGYRVPYRYGAPYNIGQVIQSVLGGGWPFNGRLPHYAVRGGRGGGTYVPSESPTYDSGPVDVGSDAAAAAQAASDNANQMMLQNSMQAAQAANDAAQAAFTQSMLDAQQTMINANN